MALPQWLEIAIGILVGVIFIMILVFLLSALAYVLAGDHVKSTATKQWRGLMPQLRQAITPGAPMAQV